jgi:precorrin-4/cobalt-precorrin-4 C11-methyltransferase
MELNEETKQRHAVLFVGAGPGDPELITVKGRNALEAADQIIYTGSLVPEALLDWARPEARRLSSASLTLEQIVAALVDGYRRGLRQVRLHTGDPSLYGAIFEQMAALQEQGVPYRVIPGVSAAFAAAAAMGIEYTLPEVTQTLILTRVAGRTPVPDRENLASLAAHRASMAIYLSIQQVDRVAAALIAAYGRDAPCAVAYRVSQPEERIVFTTAGRLAQTVAGEQITRQALIIVGQVLASENRSDPVRSKLYDRRFSHGHRKSS